MIKIDSLNFSYGDNEAVFSSFSAEFKKGERICLRSPSGSGKTTLLRLIAGLQKANSGRISFDKKFKVAYSFQNDDLFPWYSALENVSIVSNEKIAKNILCQFGLSECLNKLPAELSGGMKKRVSLARALSSKPDILLIDEGFTGIERSLEKIIMDYIIESCKNSVVIFATHDDYVCDYLSTRVISF